MLMIKPAALLTASIMAASPAAACDLEMGGGNGPHRFFAFAGELAKMRGGSAEQTSADRRTSASEESGSRGSGEQTNAQPSAPEPARVEAEQKPSDTAARR